MITLPYGLPALTDEPSLEDIANVLPMIPGLAWDRAAWVDFLGSSRAAQLRDLTVLAASAQNPGPDWAGQIVNVLETIVLVATGIAGVASAVSGIQAIKW